MTDHDHMEDLVVDYLDGALDEVRTEKCKRHLVACPACRSTVDGLGRARQAYRDAEPVEPSAETIAAISRQARRAVAPWHDARKLALAGVGAAAAALLAVGLVAFRDGGAPAAPDCQRLRAIARELARDDALVAAIERYEEATACDPSSADVAGDHHERGLLNLRLARTERALEELQTVLSLYPGYEARDEVLLALASVHETSGDRDAARETYVQFIEEFPGRSDEQLRQFLEVELTDELRERLSSLGYLK